MMQTLTCRIVSIDALTPMVYRVLLEPPQAVKFEAGQYLQVVMGERDKRPFSIASCPSNPELFELHIGAHPDNRYATEVMERLQTQTTITVEAPLGNAFYQANNDRPLILVAGGTGFSYTWSILQSHLQSGSRRPITLYWGGRERADLYFHQQLLELAERYEHFSYRPVVENVNGEWKGAVGLVHHAVLAEQSDLSEADVYVAGRFEMVRVIRDDFHANGLPLNQLYGDALAFI